MEEGFRNWSIMKKLLVDNRLDHAAMLASSIGVSEALFLMRARMAYRKIETRVAEAIDAREQAMRDLAEVMEAEAAKAEKNVTHEEEDPPAAESKQEPAPADPEVK